MEVRTKDCDVEAYAASIFQQYSKTVFADDYEGLFQFYDDSAVMIERGKESFYGANNIIDAIKAYHAGLGHGTTKNSEFKIDHTDDLITIRCKYRVQSVLTNETWEGEYLQYWKSEIGKTPKIIRDEFSIDKRY